MSPDLARRQALTLAACILGSSIAFLDAMIVVVALPTIEEELDLGLTGQQWVLLSYSLALAALYLLAGAVGDRWGRRRAFLVGVLAFAVTSAFAGAAQDEAQLIAARALQGIAGAFLTTNSLALIRSVYGRNAGKAVGLWTAFTGAATIAGTPVGGVIVEWVSWRWIFFLNLPIAAATVLLALAGRCEEQSTHPAGHLDFVGAALSALGFGTLTYGLVQGAEHGFAAQWWAFVIAVAALSVFMVVEQRVREPMLPLHLFRHRNFAFVNLETLLVYAALSGGSVFFTLYLQNIGFSPVEASVINVPTSASGLLLAPRFGALADRYGPRFFLTLGPALLGSGMLLLSLIEKRSDFWIAGIGGLALFSLGLAVFVAPITTTALSAAPERYVGVAAGVSNMVARTGGTLAVALIGAIVSVVFHAATKDPDAVPLARYHPTDASTDAFRAAMLCAAALAYAGVAVAWTGISNAQARSDSREEPEFAT
jgi:EmrB/QacA subfamily drug resistance transporter